MAKTYFVGNQNQVKRIDDHVSPGIALVPLGDADTVWRDVMTHPTNEDKVIIVGSQLFVGPGAANNSIQISDDAGATWTTPGGDWTTLADYFYEVWWCENGTTIVATSAFGHVAVSVDGGANFNLLPQIAAGAYFQTAAIHALDENTIVVAGSAGEGVTQAECFVWKWNGASWTTLNGGVTLEHPNTGQPGISVGNANGIWISPDEQTIIVATGYTNQISTDGGLTFTGDTDPGVPEVHMNRAGAHLTWYPTYQAVPDAFRHTGGSAIQITESTDGGLTWPRTRWFNYATLTPVTFPAGNSGYNIKAAHFYSLTEGYYGHKDYLFHTTDGGQTGVIVDQLANIQLVNAIWTGETVLTENPVLYTLVDCCDDSIFQDEDDNIVVFEYTGLCTPDACPIDLIGKTITFFEGDIGGIYTGTGCYSLTEILTYPTDPYVTVPYDNELSGKTIETVDTCEECCIVFPCFMLTDCNNIAEPIYTGTDLSTHLGEVVSLEGIEGCWLVEQSDINCVDVPDVTVNECYVDCEACLPQPAPISTPSNRIVLPNYSVGNCDPEIVEKAFCNHADMMYKQMLEARFKIAQCCPGDEDKINMTYEKIKLKLIETENPAPDPCNPECAYYEAIVQIGYSAVLTYTDCNEIEQTDTFGISTEVQTITVCALNSTPPVITIFDSEGNEIGSFLLYSVEDCDNPEVEIIPTHQYRITVLGGFDFSGQFFTYVDELNQTEQLDLIFAKTDENYVICAQHGTLLFNGINALFILGDDPECGGCPTVPGINIEYITNC